MKFQVVLISVMGSMICYSMAAPTIGDGENSTLVSNNSSTNHSYSEETISIPILLVVENDEYANIRKATGAELAVHDIGWMVIRKTTNISRIEEVLADDEHDKTRRVVVEDRAEEYKVYRDNKHNQVLDETIIKSIPLSFL